jgi:hypothetical protein
MNEPKPVEPLTLWIHPALPEHLRERLAQRHRDTAPEELAAALVTPIHDNSRYPISATGTDAGQIRHPLSSALVQRADPVAPPGLTLRSSCAAGWRSAR